FLAAHFFIFILLLDVAVYLRHTGNFGGAMDPTERDLSTERDLLRRRFPAGVCAAGKAHGEGFLRRGVLGIPYA
ncbi:hypothetical protein LJC67_06785, partial [Bacteroidales bacterium OttesenSCG-928-A14]|nr:hypothetical protein [Bacteroidales bacterium OttesenSCG-928-A14]